MPYQWLVLEDDERRVPINICNTCRWFLRDGPMPDALKGNRCAEGHVRTAEDQIAYMRFGGCPFYEMGAPVGEETADWLPVAQQALASGEFRIVSRRSPDEPPRAEEYDLPWAEVTHNARQHPSVRASVHQALKHQGPDEHDNTGTPQAIHGAWAQPGPGDVKVGQKFKHPKFGSVEVSVVFGNKKRAMVRFTDKTGQLDFQVVDISELVAVSTQPSQPSLPNFPGASIGKLSRRAQQGRQQKTQPPPGQESWYTQPTKRILPGLKPEKIEALTQAGGGNVNEVYKVILGGKPYVFKPAYEEVDPKRDPEVGGYQWQREIAASQIDKALGLGVVPDTRQESIEEHGPGALIEFIPNLKPGDKSKIGSVAGGDRIAVLDALMIQTDRLSVNWGEAGGQAWALDNGLGLLRSVQDSPDKPRRSAFQKQYAGQQVPADVLTRLKAMTADEFAALLPKHIDSGIKEQAVLNFEHMQKFGTIPPVLDQENWWLDPGGKLSAHIQSYQPALDAVVKDLQMLLPGASVSGRLKTVEASRRDAPRRTITPYELVDLAGTRLVIDGGLEEQKQAAATLRAHYGDRMLADSSIGLKGTGSRVMRETKEGGYRAIHFGIDQDGKRVEVQLRTRRQDIHGEYFHDAFMFPEFDNNLDFIKYSGRMSEHYYRLDRGLNSKPPKPPEIAYRFPKGLLPDDPLGG